MTAVESWVLSFLVNSLWQAPLLFAAGLLAARALRPLGPAAEHRMWVGVLLLQSVLPACSAAPFEWLRGLVLWSAGAHQTGAGNVTVIMEAGTASGGFSFPARMLAAVTLAYCGTVVWFAARFLWRWLRLGAMRSAAVESKLTGNSAEIWEKCASQLGIRAATIATSSRIFAPVTLGAWRKLLLLPTDIVSRMSDVEMQCVIAHEFAHMRRNDFLKNLVYELLSVPVSYHPALWFTRERVTESREMVCDRLAADLAGRGPYSRSLLHLASLMVAAVPSRAAHALGIFDTNTLERRLMKLAEKQSEIRAMRRIAALSACLVLGAATCASALALHMQVSSADASSHHPTRHPALINLSAKQMEGNLITKVTPKYPVEAKKHRIQGKVVLKAIIGKEGNVTDLKVESGPKELRQSSLDAVRQWKYKPYLLNGQPVAVATTVNINYSLSK